MASTAASAPKLVLDRRAWRVLALTLLVAAACVPAPLPARQFPRLSPAVGEVIYPCGACREGGDWVFSWGLNDERCAITVIPHEQVAASTTPSASATRLPPRC